MFNIIEKNLLFFNSINFYSKTFPIYKAIIFMNDLTLYIPKTFMYQTFNFLHKHSNTQYKILSDIAGKDLPNQSLRFEVIYNLLSIFYNNRLSIKIKVNETTQLPSITSIFTSANWWERELWDMFGISFTNHPDLRRILTDYGFQGHPLRKDFPLTGFFEIRYNERLKRITMDFLELSKEYHIHSFKLNLNTFVA